MFEWPTGVKRCGSYDFKITVTGYWHMGSLLSGPCVSDKVMVPFNATWTTKCPGFQYFTGRDILIIFLISIIYFIYSKKLLQSAVPEQCAWD